MPSVDSRAAQTASAEQPDRSYWTDYDHYMIEREARAMRRAYTWSLLVRGWHGLARAFAGARRADGHRRMQRLSPRT